MQLSKKQVQLINDIKAQNKNEIYVLGSTQSGKTYAISFGMLLYAQALYNYDSSRNYDAAIIGWSMATMKKNILQVMIGFLEKWGLKAGIDFYWKWTQGENYLKLYNLTFTFFAFNNQLSYNKIIGRPLICVWVDEAARIYTQKQLQEGFEQIDTRQMSFIVHPYYKKVHSFNVEGSENHDYKINILDKKQDKINYVFYPYDNPTINSKTAIQKVVELFPPGSLREQKVFNRWVVGTGRVFENINVIDDLQNYAFREIGIGIDYGSKNATTFVPIMLAKNLETNSWVLIRLQIYYHNSRELNDTPTTEYYSKQLRLFMVYLKEQFPHVPITTVVIDSEATHFHNRLLADNIPHELSKKGPGSVNSGVQHLQSLIYKGYYLVYKEKSIKHIHDDGTVELCAKDEGITEFESYQYDTIKSSKEGQDCYKKEHDHHIDATRYLLAEWVDTNRCPVV